MARAPLLLLLLWLALPLAALSSYAYGTFRETTLSNEKEDLLWQVGQLAARLNDGADMGSERTEDSGLWGSLLTSGTLVRWVDDGGHVRVEVTSDPGLAAARSATFRFLRQPAVVESDADRLYVMAPVFSGGQQSGVVELGRRLSQLVRQRRNYAFGLVVLSLISLTITGIVVSMYSRMHRNSSLDRQRRYWADLFHELRTPLTVIESYAGMLKRWAGSDPKLREEAIAVIVSEASRLRRLTARLLSDSDWSEREPPLHLVAFDLVSQLRDVAQRMEASFGRDIRAEGEPPALQVTGDPEQLQQLWIILLDNAIKYSDKPIGIEIAAGSEEVDVIVRDCGIGIPYQELPYLFDRHYRGLNVRRRPSGSGLGLSIAGGIVRRHGGSIHIDSEPGAGTAVTVTLPIR